MRLYAIFCGLRPRRTFILFVSRWPRNPHATWRPDQVYLKIGGRMAYLCRTVDAEGEVLDVPGQSKRNKYAAPKLARKLLRKYAFAPEGWPRPTSLARSRNPQSARNRHNGARLFTSHPFRSGYYGAIHCGHRRRPLDDQGAHARRRRPTRRHAARRQVAPRLRFSRVPWTAICKTAHPGAQGSRFVAPPAESLVQGRIEPMRGSPMNVDLWQYSALRVRQKGSSRQSPIVFGEAARKI
jgi:hypothetical protein